MDEDEIRRQWADRTGEYSPRYYAHYGPNDASELLRGLLEEHVDRDARVLELGCSVGRHLAHLHDAGFDHLAGVEINADAREVMAEHYPDLARAGTFHFESIQSAVRDFETDQFDAVYSVETLQHLPPEDDWVYEELARVTDGVLITIETEEPAPEAEPAGRDVNYVNDEFPLYYRDWRSVFENAGCEQLAVQRRERDTVRAFRAPGGDPSGASSTGSTDA